MRRLVQEGQQLAGIIRHSRRDTPSLGQEYAFAGAPNQVGHRVVTWTILKTSPNGTACIMAVGEGWQDDPPVFTPAGLGDQAM